MIRHFEEPLVPIGGDPPPAENAALAAALHTYAKRKTPDDFSCITGFLQDYPNSPWNGSLWLNLGLAYYSTGYYTQDV
jgi:hypothetical protein